MVSSHGSTYGTQSKFDITLMNPALIAIEPIIPTTELIGETLVYCTIKFVPKVSISCARVEKVGPSYQNTVC